ncbi:ABC transporter permease [Limobrevibacterium gyesilva]|uniref:ABC transporter permease n=1 Tax=Limobrevibacterium gyesilva TaxID=2991712 RepID=A0AA42CGH2_9PROT|nr:ABC transporter permease [Limobrevibacterium gyesilva]
MTRLRPGLLAVAAREVRWIFRGPVARFLLFGVPVIAFAVLGFTFSHAVVRGLDVVAVDMDNSATSRVFIQAIAAAPGITVAERANDLGAAASAIRAGRAIAAIYLPPEFGKDVLAGRAPRPVAFTNTQFFTPGNNAAKSIRDAMSAANAAVAPARQAVGDRAEAGLVPEEYVLSNPALNYAQFLLRAVLPTVLHVVIAISAGYAVGSEFRRRSMRAWWDLSGHSIAAALFGKLLPYYVVLMLMFVLMVGILDVWLGVSFRGSAVLTAVSATLLIVAYQMIGCLMQLLARNMAFGLSLTGIIVSPAFGYAGVGFPVLAMQSFPRAWGAILPLRWYIQILFDQASRGAALRFTAEPFAVLSGLTVVLALLVWLRFRSLARRGLIVPEEAEPPLDAAAPGAAGAFAAEWRRAISDRGVFGLFVLAPVLYAVFYPQPYLGQIVRNIPIAVVDQDGSELGRALTQALQAHGNISVALRASSYREAEEAIFARRAFAIMGIPPDTEKNVLKGVTARLPIYADSTYFILFNRSLQGMLETVQAYAADALAHGARTEGASVQAATRLSQPVELIQVPLFNPTASYSSYVVPAAFVLILHQTLLMGAAMLGGVAFERGGHVARRARASAAAILGQGLAHWTLYVPAMLLYFVVMPRVYGFSTLGSVWALAALSIPFILATSFLGQALGLLFRHRETAVLLVLATSLPQFFLVGVSWPAEALPGFLHRARELLPSVNAINGMVRINQMGASLTEVRPDWVRLCALTLLYFVIAAALAHLRAARASSHAPAV